MNKVKHITVTNSYLSQFKTCNAKGNFIYHDLYSDKQSPALLFGIRFHEEAARFYRNQGRKWQSYPSPVKYSEEHFSTIMANYVKNYADEPSEVSMVEQTIVVKLSDRVSYKGTIDIATKSGVVRDHKTTGYVANWAKENLEPSMQLMGYCWLYAQATGQWPSAYEIDLISTDPKDIDKGKLFSRLAVDVEPELLDDWKKETLFFVEQTVIPTIEHGIYTRSGAPKTCNEWGGCPFKPVCTRPLSYQPEILASFLKSSNNSEKIFVEFADALPMLSSKL